MDPMECLLLFLKLYFCADTLPGQTFSPLPINVYLSSLLEVCLHTACP